MKKSIFSAALIVSFIVVPKVALAHCPLCTVGAGVAALVAVGLGVDTMTVGVFIGAFALALGLWVGRLVPPRFGPWRQQILGGVSFLLTVLPLLPLMADYSSFYLSWFGPYGSWFNRTYIVNRFLIGSIIGAFLLFLAPAVSSWVTRFLRWKRKPFQGVVITFLLLTLTSLIIEFLL